MSVRFLFVADVDGTLLTDAGAVLPEDSAAIRRAQEAGVGFTLASGRLPERLLPVARELDLTLPAIAADGAVTVCPRSGAVLSARTLDAGVLAAAVPFLRAAGLAVFLLSTDGVHTRPADTRRFGLAASWGKTHPLDGTRPALQVLGVGRERAVLEAHAGFEADGVDKAAFRLAASELWALRLQPAGNDKARAVATLAAQLGVPPERVAAIGDWYNDLGMLAWCGTSFAMANSPAPVRARASHVVGPATGQGGGVAAALGRLAW